MLPVIPLLRKIDLQRAALEAVAHQCFRHGAEVRWDAMPGGESYLRFRLERADRTLVCRVRLTTWFHAHWPDMQGLAWGRCDEGILQRLVNASFPPVQFDGPWFGCDRAHFLGRHDNVGEQALPCVDSREGPVWIEQFDAGLPSRPHALGWPSSVALPVDYRIGMARVPVRRLAKLRTMDVVLFDMVAGVAHVGEKPIFHFNFSMEHIVVEDFLSNIESTDMDNVEPREEGVDVSALTLSLDVVLCRMQQTVGELNDMQQGVTLPLPENAHRSVRLMVDRQCVALGEVVQVGERLGVQITSVMPRS